MDNTIKKVFYIVSIILSVIAAAYQIAVLYQGDEAFALGASASKSTLNGFFIVTYITFAIALILVLYFPVIQIISNPKGAVKTLIMLGAAVVLWFIARLMSKNEFSPQELDTLRTTAETSVIVGAGLIYTYFIFGVALALIVYSNVSNMLK